MTKEAVREFIHKILNAYDQRELIRMVAEFQKELPEQPNDTERALMCLLITSIAMLHDRLLEDLNIPDEMRTSLSILWMARLSNAIPLIGAIVRVGHAVMSELGDEDLGGIGPEVAADISKFAPQIETIEQIRQMDRDIIDSHNAPPEEGQIDGSFLQHLREAEERGDTPPTEE